MVLADAGSGALPGHPARGWVSQHAVVRGRASQLRPRHQDHRCARSLGVARRADPYLADDGAFIHPLEAAANPLLTDRDVMIYSLKAGYGKTGAKIGSRDGEAQLFRDEMMAFWNRVLGG